MSAIHATWSFQQNDVVFIEGPCRGQRMAIHPDKTSVEMQHLPEVDWLSSRHDDVLSHPCRTQQTHYYIHVLFEEHGVLEKEIRVASIEPHAAQISCRDLLPVEDVMRRMPWSLGHEPSFLIDFDRWFVWASYKNDAGSRQFRNWIESGGMSWRAWDRVGRFMFHGSLKQVVTDRD